MFTRWSRQQVSIRSSNGTFMSGVAWETSFLGPSPTPCSQVPEEARSRVPATVRPRLSGEIETVDPVADSAPY